MRFIGSGTLVEIQGTHHILTAAHVWHETRDGDQIGLVLTPSPSKFVIPRGTISVKQLRDRENPERGPDLALLQLPRPDVSTIAAHKSFLNLAQEKATLAVHPSATEKGLWAVTGMVGEFSPVQRFPEVKTIEATAQARAFFSTVQQTHQRGGYDYLDFGAKLELPGVPSSFGGMSGGGALGGWPVDGKVWDNFVGREATLPRRRILAVRTLRWPPRDSLSWSPKHL